MVHDPLIVRDMNYATDDYLLKLVIPRTWIIHNGLWIWKFKLTWACFKMIWGQSPP